MDFLKVLRVLLTTFYKMSEGDIDAILTASGEDQAKLITAIQDKHAVRVQEIIDGAKPPAGQTFKDGEKKGFREALTNLEKLIREEYNLESTSTGIDLVKEAVSANAGSGKLDPESVKKHPEYLSLEKSMRKAIETNNTEWQGKLDAIEANNKKANIMQTINNKAIDVLNGLKPIISANANIARNTQNGFLNSFANIEFQINEDGGIVMSKDGKVMKDKHGHTLEFDELIKSHAEGYYEFAQNNGGGNGGNGKDGTGKGNNQNGGNGGGGYQKPKTLEDLNKITRDRSIPLADRQKAQAEWDAENPS